MDFANLKSIPEGYSPLAERLPPLILGGAGFSYQQSPSPETLPVASILKRAFDLGLRCIDTSPYYEPSEQLIGKALASPTIRNTYARSSYMLMTKVGRLSVDKFDYSPEWIRASVARSLQRLNTSYLDVIFVHDIEFMSLDQALSAVSTLMEISNEQPGVIRCIGISGYSLPALVKLATRVRHDLPRALDAVQVWGQLSLQNSTLATDSRYGLAALRDTGVKLVFSSSPLAAGLLRDVGVPVGALGDWHPAPQGLRKVCDTAARWLKENSENFSGRKEELASLALRYSIFKAWRVEIEIGRGQLRVRTVVGVSSIEDLEANVKAARRCLKSYEDHPREGISVSDVLDEATEKIDIPLFLQVRKIIGPWVDFDFTSQKRSPIHSACAKEEQGGKEAHIEAKI